MESPSILGQESKDLSLLGKEQFFMRSYQFIQQLTGTLLGSGEK